MPQGDEHIEQIRTALWNQSKHPGASVMIGAGFSLNAVKLRPDASPFLTWSQLAERFERDLGYLSMSGRGTSDALRLASEFEGSFGPNKLETLLQEAAPDNQYKPGPLHSLLVSLPWADIFTTNYDQLLERAAQEAPERRYSVIRTIHDIPLSARPRIVKLHGSFPSHRPFIITEEHYRTYPQAFAPFANLVRQAVMETAFCLLGFSGDDPNFLQWAGWVRDSLGTSAPAIYLCGILDLTSSRQHLLRSRHVIPIDLAGRFPRHQYPDPNIRHGRALEWFLLSLLEGRPIDDSDWPNPPPPRTQESSVGLPALLPPRNHLAIQPQSAPPDIQNNDTELDISTLVLLFSKWHSERSWYPGWTCLPENNRRELWLDMKMWMSDPRCASWIKAVDSLPPIEALLAWYEIVWRIEKTLCPLADAHVSAVTNVLGQINPFPAQVTDLQAILTPQTDISPSDRWPRSGAPAFDWSNVARCWVELAFAVVRCARENFDIKLHACWMHRLAQLAHLQPEYQDRYLCEQATFHLFYLEQQKLSEILSLWQPTPIRPYWQAKHAALLAEYGDLKRAKEELDSALAAPTATSQGLASVSRQALSEEGWILWLLDALDNDFGPGPHVRRSYERKRRLNDLSQYGCDPDELLSALNRGLREAKLRQVDLFQGDESFDPGYKKRLSTTFYQHDPEAWFFVRALEVGTTFVRAPGHVVYKKAVVESALELFFDGQRKLALSLLIRCGANDVLASLLDRATIASLEQSFVAEIYQWLAQALREAVNNTTRIRARDNDLSARLIIPIMQIVSYLLFRLESPMLTDARALLIELYRAEAVRSDHESIQALRLLFRRVFYCMTSEQVRDWLPDLLTLPMSESKDRLGIVTLPEVLEEWRHPLGVRVQRDEASGQWADIITTLLANLALTGEMRSRAATRLIVLYLVGGLTHTEEISLAESLWRRSDEHLLPAGTNLRDAMWLRLPTPSDASPLELLRQKFLKEEYPIILREHSDGRRGISSGDVFRFVEHVSSIEECSHMAFGYLGKRQGITWTLQEAHVLFEKLERWTGANTSARSNNFDMFNDARTEAMSLLMHVLAPLLSANADALRRMIAVANALGCTDRRMTAVSLLGRLAGDDSAEGLGKALIDAFYDLTPSGKERVKEAGDVLLLWLSCADSTLTNSPPSSMTTRIVESLVGIRHTELVSRLVLVSNLLRWFPAQIDDYGIETLERMLEYLADVTALTSEIPSAPAARSEARAKPILRAISANVAFRLFQLYSERSRLVSGIVQRWRALVENDPLPEVRLAWSDSFHVP